LKTILVTSVGGRVGDDVLTLLAPLSDRLRVVGVNSVARASQNFRCDRTHLVPPTTRRAEWLAAMRAILRSERPDLVLPLRDGDVEPLAVLAAEAEFRGTQFFCADAATVGIIVDKARTAAFAQDNGLVFADTVVDAGGLDGLIARRGLPLIAKPRTGSGSHGVRLIRSRMEAEAALAVPDMIVQEFVDPPASTATVALDLSAGLPFFFVMPDRSHLSALAGIAADGAVSYSGTVHVVFKSVEAASSMADDDPDLARIARDWATALARAGARGAVNVQCRRSATRGCVPFEVNGRLPGGAMTRRMFGQDGFAGALRALLGHDPIDYPPVVAGRMSDRIFNVTKIDPPDLERLSSAGVWSRH